MFKKALTYLTILAITALPVQLISASAETVSMQMSMSQQIENKCMLGMLKQGVHFEQNSMDKSCCDDQSHECASCDNCPQAVTAMLLPFDIFVKASSAKAYKYSTSYLSLDGIPQNNLLRPPRILI